MIISLAAPKGAPLQTAHAQQRLLTLWGEGSARDLLQLAAFKVGNTRTTCYI